MNKPKRRSIWIDDSLWERIAAAAKKDGRSASNWLRAIAAAAIVR